MFGRPTIILSTIIAAMLLVACGTSEPPTSTPGPTAPPSVSPTTEGAADGVRTFVIVPEESTASYIAQEEFFADALTKYGINPGLGTPTGTTQEIEGQFAFDFGEQTLGENTFSVNLPSLTTDQSLRDEWIRDNALESNRFPTAKFVGNEIEGGLPNYMEGEEISFTLGGDMTIRDITNPLAFDVVATLDGDTLTGVASAESKLTGWGIDPPSFLGTLTVADDFTIRVEFTAREQ